MSPPITPAAFLWYDGVWNDISTYVYYRDPITIVRGTPNESNTADPAACNFTLNNRSGRFSPRNPRSPLYGKIGKNTPIWILASVATPNDHGLFLPNTGVTATTPDNVALDIVGDIDLRAEIRPLDIINSQSLIAKGATTGGQLSYQLAMGSNTAKVPHLTMRWSVDGTVVSFVDHDIPELQFGKRIAVRATLQVNNGAGAKVITFYTSSDNTLGGTWVQHGAAHTVAGTTSIFSGTGALEVGRNGTLDYYYGTIYGVRVLNGIAGTAVANPDFKTQAIGAVSFSDAAGRAWTVTGTIGYTQFSRFFGEVSAWPQQWDQSGKDVYVPIQAAGISRRLGQGQLAATVDSVKLFVKNSIYLRFWPGDTAADLLRAGTVAFYTPFKLTPVKCPAVTFGTGDLGLAGKGLSIPTTAPVRDANGYLQNGYVEGMVGRGADTQVAAGFVFKADSLGVLSLVIAEQYDPNGGKEYEIQLRGDGTNNDVAVIKRVNNFDTGVVVTNLGDTAPLDAITDGKLHVCVFTEIENGTGVDWAVQIDGVVVLNGNMVTTTVNGAQEIHIAYDPTAITGSPASVGYLALWADANVPNLTDFASVALGHPGEAAGTRISRLCDENAVAFYPYGDLTTTAAMGVQAAGTFTSLIQEAATTDAGFLFDDLHQASLFWNAGLSYITRASLYNRPSAVTLDYAAHIFGSPLNPPEDDATTHNDVTVTNSTGGSAQARLLSGALSVQPPPNGINTYPTSASVNLQTDGPLPDHAAWRMHLSTVDEARYPQLSFNLLTPEVLNHSDLVNDVLALDVTSGLTIKNLPAWLPPDDVSQLLLGYTETFTQFSWTFDANTTPGSPYQPAIYGTDRYDVEASWVDTGVSSGATALPVVVGIADQQWTTDGPAFPFDINVGGEKCTVTGATYTPITFVGIGTAATGNNTSVTPGLPAGVAVGDVVFIWASIRATAATMAVPAGWTHVNFAANPNARLVARVYDGVWTMPTVTFSGGAAGDDTIGQSCAFRGIRLEVLSQWTGSSPGMNSQAFALGANGKENLLVLWAGWLQGTFATAAATTALGTPTEIQETVSIVGNDEGQVWAYLLNGVDAAGSAPALVWATTGAPSVQGAVIVAAFRRVPQTLTVVRAVNGIVKAQTAGTPVRLWKTPRYAL